MTPDWELALCARTRPPMRGWWTSRVPSERLAARLACRDCPIVEACADWAIATLPQTDTAVYGAMTYKERIARRTAWLAAARGLAEAG
jgi:Transcription factor WhiB